MSNFDLAAIPVPALGDVPEFDEYVEERLAEEDDGIDDEMSGLFKAYCDMYDGAVNSAIVQVDLEAQAKIEDMGRILWESWVGGEDGVWQTVVNLSMENVHLYSQLNARDDQIDERDARIAQLAHTATQEQSRHLEEENARLKNDLKAQMEYAAVLRDTLYCRLCYGLVFHS